MNFFNWLNYASAIMAGLLAGSFLNVVIHRGPALWGLLDDSRGDLAAPRSYCPSCRVPIGLADLVPLFGFVRLGGKCRACGAAISWRYPAVELAGAAAAAAALATFGLSWSALFAAVFLMALIALAAIDAETGFLPDAITAPLAWAGLLVNLQGRFAPLDAAVIGAAVGYGAFRLVAEAYRLIRRREGLGGGDAKLLAAFGAWGGWTVLAPSVLIGALAALAYVLAARLFGRRIDAETPVPFGPGLCVGGAVSVLIGL